MTLHYYYMHITMHVYACTLNMYQRNGSSRTRASSGWSACSGVGRHCQLLRWCSQSWKSGEASAMRACSSRLLQSSMARRCRRRCLDLFTHMARHQPCTCTHAQPWITWPQAMRTASTVGRALAREASWHGMHGIPMLMNMACMFAGW